MNQEKRDKRKKTRASHKAQHALLRYLKEKNLYVSSLGDSKNSVVKMVGNACLGQMAVGECTNEFLIKIAKKVCKTSHFKKKSTLKKKYQNFKGTNGGSVKITKFGSKDKLSFSDSTLFAKTKEFLESWEWTTLRYKVLKKHGRRCMCCGATPESGAVICVDHIKPRHTHPELALSESNLQVLCFTCNKGKGAWDQTDFRA